ncbi:hypothetical protein Tco_1286281 [Tanacetum coccineum]
MPDPRFPKNYKAYNVFFKYSTGLIPPKKSRGRAVKEDLPKEPTKPKQKPSKVTHATKEPVAPKKVTASSKKKLTKRNKKRVLKAVVIQEPQSVPVKQTYDSSGKLKGIEILSNVAQFEIDTLKAQKANRHESRLQPHVGGSSEGTGSKPRVPDELTGKSVVLDEGACIQLKVHDETKNLSESDDDSDKWGSTNEEVFHVVPRDENPKSPPSDLSDNDDLNESEDDDDERVETDDDDDERVETDDDRDDDEEEVDRSTDIKENDAESTESDDEHQGKGDADMNIEQEVEKEMSDENQSLSSGFANQFLFNSPNASLLGTITKPAEGDITSIMDVPIQQDVPTVVLEPLNIVIVIVIPEATQAPPPPAVTTVTLTTQVPNTVVISFVVQRFSKMKQFYKQLKETDFSSVIHDSITSQVPSIVDKYHGSSLPDAFRKEFLANNAALKKELSELNYKEVIKESVEGHVSVKAYAVNKDVIEESVKAHVGKETNKRRTRKETESSKKSSNPKESSRVKPPSKPSKSRKSRSANDVVEETVFEMGLYDVDQTFDKKADDSEQPSLDANTKQPFPDISANPKRKKNDWYKKYPSPEPQDPDWNTIKKIDDAQEQPWFKEKVNAAVPPLTFDELMSTPIDFSAFAMNRIGLKTLSREVLVGPVFNLLKGTYKSYGELEYNFEECFCALTDTDQPTGTILKDIPPDMASLYH